MTERDIRGDDRLNYTFDPPPHLEVKLLLVDVRHFDTSGVSRLCILKPDFSRQSLKILALHAHQ